MNITLVSLCTLICNSLCISICIKSVYMCKWINKCMYERMELIHFIISYATFIYKFTTIQTNTQDILSFTYNSYTYKWYNDDRVKTKNITKISFHMDIIKRYILLCWSFIFIRMEIYSYSDNQTCANVYKHTGT